MWSPFTEGPVILDVGQLPAVVAQLWISSSKPEATPVSPILHNGPCFRRSNAVSPCQGKKCVQIHTMLKFTSSYDY